MNSLETYSKTSVENGFTLIELSLVIALMFMIGAFISPTGISFYKGQLLNESYEGMINALRQAQIFSMTGKNNHSFGLFIQDDSYVVFEGDSYSTRIQSEDVVFTLSPSVTISGIEEIVFSKLTGEPSVLGGIVISVGEKEKQIEVSTSGNID